MIVCLRCGVLEGAPSRCPSCGGDVWDAAGKDRGFVLDYLKLRAPARSRVSAIAATAAGIAAHVGATVAWPDLGITRTPLLMVLVPVPVYFAVERLGAARFTAAQRALEALVPPSPMPRRIGTGVPVAIFVLCCVVLALEQVPSLGVLDLAMRPRDILRGERLYTLMTS